MHYSSVKQKSFLLLVIGIAIVATLLKSCSTSTEKETGQNESSVSLEADESKSINGVYRFKDYSVELIMTVSDSTWNGKTKIISGFGEDYDNENAQYDNGILHGNDLYESSGMVKVGYIQGRSLTTSLSGHQFTLHKQ